MGCSVWAEAGRDGDGDMDSGERLRPWWGTALRRKNEGEKRGEQYGAHRGPSEGVSGLGDVLRVANRRRWWSEPEVEDDGDGGSTGRPEGHGLTERWWTTWRGYRTRSEGEGEVVAAATASGGVGGVRP